MKPDELDTILSDYFTDELRSAPRQHSQETDQCPSLLRFPAGVHSGWRGQPENRNHVSNCPFCQKVTAMQWRIQCPSLVALVRNALPNGPDRDALEIHVHQDNCARCQPIYETVCGTMDRLGALLHPVEFRRAVFEAAGPVVKRPLDLPDVAKAVAATFVVVPARWQLAGSMAVVAQPRPQLHQISADESLIANLRVADGNLLLWVRSPLKLEDRASWKVRASVVIDDGEPLEAEFDLEDRGADGHIATHSFGAFDEALARRMDKPFALVVEWVD